MIDNNTLDLIKEYLNTRERSNMDSELSDILVVRKLLFISILQNLILSKKIFIPILFFFLLFNRGGPPGPPLAGYFLRLLTFRKIRPPMMNTTSAMAMIVFSSIR